MRKLNIAKDSLIYSVNRKNNAVTKKNNVQKKNNVAMKRRCGNAKTLNVSAATTKNNVTEKK